MPGWPDTGGTMKKVSVTADTIDFGGTGTVTVYYESR